MYSFFAKQNKKQRTLVRATVIKQKDPMQVLADLERLDQMEFNVNTSNTILNEKVLSDKRRKLTETWERLMRHYVSLQAYWMLINLASFVWQQKDEKDKFIELTRLEGEYQLKREEMKKYYESVKSAEAVDLNEIPLPSLPDCLPSDNTGFPSLPSSSHVPSTPQSILSRRSAPVLSHNRNRVDRKPPGPPPGPPPDLIEFDDEHFDGPDDDQPKSKKVKFGERAEGKSSKSNKEEDVDNFLKEIEKDLPVAANAGPPNQQIIPNFNLPPGVRPPSAAAAMMQMMRGPPPSSFQLPPGQPPPPLRHGMGAMIPPPAALSMSFNAPGNRGPNPKNPIMNRPPFASSGQQNAVPHQGVPAVKQGATIEAKAQLRNLSADATRLIPVSLRVKRQPDKQQLQKRVVSRHDTAGFERHQPPSSTPVGQINKPSTDDAYDQFMKELGGMI